MRRNYDLISLFTGAGGLDYGFESTGRFKTMLAIEHQPEFCETLRDNQERGYLSDAIVIEKDVSCIDPAEACRVIAPDWHPDGVIGGPPCQSFSTMGNRKGLRDHRGAMVFVFLDWVKALKPRFFLMENVPELASVHGGTVCKMLEEGFQSAGYTVAKDILMAADYGAATLRRRLFFVGFIDVSFSFPLPSHAPSGTLFAGRTLLPYVTASEAMACLPLPGSSFPGDLNAHFCVSHTATVSRRFESLKPGSYDRIRKRARLSPNCPGPSLVAGNLNGIRSHIHPTEPRELTNRESARIQGFPDDFNFSGNHAAMGVC